MLCGEPIAIDSSPYLLQRSRQLMLSMAGVASFALAMMQRPPRRKRPRNFI